MNQHLIRSIVAIRNQGGVTLSNGDKVMPDPILIGRNAEKIEALAKANGYEFCIDRRTEDIAARVKEITGGAGVPVVFDSVGKVSFEASLNSLAPRGYFVSFGTTTGAPAASPASIT